VLLVVPAVWTFVLVRRRRQPPPDPFEFVR
jgi:hypothetical protein